MGEDLVARRAVLFSRREGGGMICIFSTCTGTRPCQHRLEKATQPAQTRAAISKKQPHAQLDRAAAMLNPARTVRLGRRKPLGWKKQSSAAVGGHVVCWWTRLRVEPFCLFQLSAVDGALPGLCRLQAAGSTGWISSVGQPHSTFHISHFHIPGVNGRKLAKGDWKDFAGRGPEWFEWKRAVTRKDPAACDGAGQPTPTNGPVGDGVGAKVLVWKPFKV